MAPFAVRVSPRRWWGLWTRAHFQADELFRLLRTGVYQHEKGATRTDQHKLDDVDELYERVTGRSTEQEDRERGD